MEISKYKQSWVKYIDCFEGFKEFSNKSIDLCITDPPWNVAYEGLTGLEGGKTKNPDEDYYEDVIENYPEWSLSWFTEIQRICKNIVLACGRQNLQLWYKMTDPTDLFIWFKPNGAFGSVIATYNNFDPYLIYIGEGCKKRVYPTNCVKINSDMGFSKKEKFIHPSPKSLKLWKYLIKPMEPESVIDPFMGSGTTLEACIELDIPFCYGFEKNLRYKQDIEFRINRKKPIQTMDKFF